MLPLLLLASVSLEPFSANAINGLPPGAPANISVAVWSHYAEVRWLDSAKGGLPTHYVVKWQAKDRDEVYWHPDWIGIGNEIIRLEGLHPGETYALRVAAVNTQGRAWSTPAIFSTLSTIWCTQTQHWSPLLDEADARELCAEEHAKAHSEDPDTRNSCSVGVSEYLLAGVAAGGTIALVGLAMLLQCPFARRAYAAEDDADDAPYSAAETARAARCAARNGADVPLAPVPPRASASFAHAQHASGASGASKLPPHTTPNLARAMHRWGSLESPHADRDGSASGASEDAALNTADRSSSATHESVGGSSEGGSSEVDAAHHTPAVVSPRALVASASGSVSVPILRPPDGS